MQDIQKTTKPSAIALMANRVSVEPLKLLDTLKGTVFKGATNEELLALVVVSNEYQLNPFLREIYAFPGRNGGIVPIVPIDGWTRIVNRQENFDGVDFGWKFDETTNKPISCTCTIHIKGRSRPVVVTEFFDECYRKTDPWNTMPKRMLRHKAFMQCARVAFGLSGVYDDDEAKDQGVTAPETLLAAPGAIDVTSEPAPAKAESAPAPAQTPRTPQDELALFVIEAGYDFTTLQRFGEESGNIPDASSMTGFEEIPKAVALRLIRAKTGLLQGLSKIKEGVAV